MARKFKDKYRYNRSGEKANKRCNVCKEYKPMSSFMSKTLVTEYPECRECKDSKKANPTQTKLKIDSETKENPVCEDCIYFGNLRCGYSHVSVVTGETIDDENCNTVRAVEAYCGSKGKWFERREYEHDLCPRPECKSPAKIFSENIAWGCLYFVTCTSCGLRTDSVAKKEDAWALWDK
jgi:hypothetical protein